MIKFAIKDKIEGNELDLSLNELTEVPVKELAAAPKATHLDLSCNRIECLPANFATLTHLVKIDLSKNSVKELPYNFGNLINLQFLDLYANEIEILPVSFCRLKSLRWLDLKNNPLDSKLKAIAGDCLDEKQCQSCAKKVVSFMQVIESELEREKQKRLKVEREKEAKKKAKEEHELEVQRRLKKAERERKKAESKARKEEAQQQQSQNSSGGDVPVNNDANSNMKIKQTPKSGMSWTTVFALLLAIPLLCAVAMVAFRVINGHQVQSVTDLSNVFEEACLELHELLSVWWQAFLIPYFHCTKASVLQLMHSISLFNASSVF